MKKTFCDFCDKEITTDKIWRKIIDSFHISDKVPNQMLDKSNLSFELCYKCNYNISQAIRDFQSGLKKK